MKTIFEEMGGTYHKCGDYLIPNIFPPESDTTLNETVERIISQLAESEGINGEMKASDPMEWTQHMNNIRNRAEEIVYREAS